VKIALRENEAMILGGIASGTIIIILCGVYFIRKRPEFLYMPIYDGSIQRESGNSDDYVDTELPCRSSSEDEANL